MAINATAFKLSFSLYLKWAELGKQVFTLGFAKTFIALSEFVALKLSFHITSKFSAIFSNTQFESKL